VKATLLRSTLENLAQIGRADVVLPLGRTLFPEEGLRSAADRFPDAVRLQDGRLILNAAPDAHLRLREVLRHVYESRP
jgi:hypothetical protein